MKSNCIPFMEFSLEGSDSDIAFDKLWSHIVPIHVIPQLSDNYAYLICDDESKECAVVDCAEADKVLEFVEGTEFTLTKIFTTHWHPDHSSGNEKLLEAIPDLEIFGGIGEKGRVPCMTSAVCDNDQINVGRLLGSVISIPAHTSGHVAYYFPSEKSVFTGDTLFIGGCGRVFEGQAETMLNSLERLARLPLDTKIYCGHEYTEKNLRFALTLEPDNSALMERYHWAVKIREDGKYTVPSTVADELATNPFLRTSNEKLVENIRRLDPTLSSNPVDIFKKARLLKDNF